jgi:hypothetical protein
VEGMHGLGHFYGDGRGGSAVGRRQGGGGGLLAEEERGGGDGQVRGCRRRFRAWRRGTGGVRGRRRGIHKGRGLVMTTHNVGSRWGSGRED